jgi:hypothetical protein
MVEEIEAHDAGAVEVAGPMSSIIRFDHALRVTVPPPLNLRSVTSLVMLPAVVVKVISCEF